MNSITSKNWKNTGYYRFIVQLSEYLNCLKNHIGDENYFSSRNYVKVSSIKFYKITIPLPLLN